MTRTIAPAPPSPTDQAAEALFEEARQRARRRRRRRALLVGASLLLIVGLAVILGQGGGGRRSNSERRPEPVPARPSAVLEREPYVGVSCSKPNSVTCDRVGIAVWTRRPATEVTAAIGGRAVRLDDREWSGPSRHGARRMFAGFLHHAGLRGNGPLAVRIENHHSLWTGVHPVTARMQVVIAYSDGSRRVTGVRVGLSTGWG